MQRQTRRPKPGGIRNREVLFVRQITKGSDPGHCAMPGFFVAYGSYGRGTRESLRREIPYGQPYSRRAVRLSAWEGRAPAKGARDDLGGRMVAGEMPRRGRLPADRRGDEILRRRHPGSSRESGSIPFIPDVRFIGESGTKPLPALQLSAPDRARHSTSEQPETRCVSVV